MCPASLPRPVESALLSLIGRARGRLSSPNAACYFARASRVRARERCGHLAFGFSPSGVIQPADDPTRIERQRAAQFSETANVADTFDGEASEAAARYAQAVFELAKEAKALDAVEQDFAKFAAAWSESADLRAAARSPLIDPEEKARALVAVAAKLGLERTWAASSSASPPRTAAPPNCRASSRRSAPCWRASAAPARSRSSPPARWARRESRHRRRARQAAGRQGRGRNPRR